ncbi:MAG: carboxypeptidase-like regulatory domain-containing protein [Spirochaetia bacterium]
MRNAKVSLIITLTILISGCTVFTPTGMVGGKVIETTTGEGLAGVSVSVRGNGRYSTVTSGDGGFLFEVPAGDQELLFALSGYTIEPIPVTVSEGETVYIPEGRIAANPEIEPGKIRFVLTWGEVPYDLDSHLITPRNSHISFANDAPEGAGAYLDVDDTESFGPETITIEDQSEGIYRYFIHNYTGTPDLTVSQAVVRIYTDAGLIKTYSVPETGEGRFWNVAVLEGTEITDIDEITTKDPTGTGEGTWSTARLPRK